MVRILRAESILFDSQPDISVDHINRVHLRILVDGLGSVIAACLVYALYVPGVMNLDSMDMLCQAATGIYTDWHSPLLSLIWRPLNAMVSGQAAILALTVAVFSGALYYFRRSGLFVLAVLLFPPVFCVIGVIGKDSAFAAVFVLFLALIKYNRTSAAFIVFLIGAAIRLDGIAAMAPALAFALYRRTDRVLVGVAAAGVLSIVSVIAVGILNHDLLDAQRRFNFQPTMIWDVTAISLRTGTDLMPQYIQSMGGDMDFLRSNYSPRYSDRLVWNTPLLVVENAAEVSELSRDWAEALFRHPILYLKHRAWTFLFLLGIRAPLPGQIYNTEIIDRQPSWCPRALPGPINGPRNPVITAYYKRLLPAIYSWPIFRGWLYDLVISIVLVVAWWRKNALAAVIGCCGMAQQFGLLFASPGGFFRYLMPTVMATLLMAAELLPAGAMRKRGIKAD